MSLTPIFPQITSPAQAQAEVIVNQALAALQALAIYAFDEVNSTGLTWAYLGSDDSYWGGFQVDAGTLTLTNTATNYLVVEKATGIQTTSTASTNWDDTEAYCHVYKVTTAGGVVTAIEDHRTGPHGVHGGGGSTGGGGGSPNLDGGVADSNFGGTTAIDGGTA